MTTNLAYNYHKKDRTDFSRKEIPWDYFVDEISKVFKLSKIEKRSLFCSTTAKLIATIPFEAGCFEPEKTAIAHLGLYIMEKRGFQKYCAHQPTDDVNILHRLDFIATFEGGNPLIIEHGMYLLALIMIEGYNRSVKKDIKNDVYNPIANGRWDYESKKKEILSVLKKIECSKLDSIIFLPYTEIPREW